MFITPSFKKSLIVEQFQGNYLKANLAEIQLKNHENVQKTHFLQKAPGVNGLSFSIQNQPKIVAYY